GRAARPSTPRSQWRHFFAVRVGLPPGSPRGGAAPPRHSGSGRIPGPRQDLHGAFFALAHRSGRGRLDAGGAAYRGGVVGGPRHLAAGWDGTFGGGLPDRVAPDLG